MPSIPVTVLHFSKTRYLKFSKVSRIRFCTSLLTTVFTVLKETFMSVTPEGDINVIST